MRGLINLNSIKKKMFFINSRKSSKQQREERKKKRRRDNQGLHTCEHVYERVKEVMKTSSKFQKNIFFKMVKNMICHN